MKTKLCTLLLCSICTWSITAQDHSFNPEVNWTEKASPAKGRFTDYSFLKGDENVIVYFYRTGIPPESPNTGDYIVRHDLRDNTTTNLKIELKNKKKTERNFECIELINDKIYLFSSFNNKKHKKYYFFSETINTEPLAYNQDERMIAEIDYSNLKGGKIGDFNVALSPDSSHLLLSYFLLNKKDKILSFGLNVLDKEMNVIVSHKDNFPEIEKKKTIWYGRYVVDNSGDVYVSARIYGKKQSKLFITYFPKDGSGSKVREIQLSEGKYTLAEKLATNNKNELICAGFYAKIGVESASGVFSAVFPASFKEASLHETEFGNDFITKGMSDKEAQHTINAKDKGKDFDGNYVYLFKKDVHFREDGGFDIAAEKYSRTLVTQQNGPVINRYYVHYYDDVFLFSYKPDGSVKWMQKIPRNQKLYGQQNVFSSYLINYDEKENVNVLYNYIKTNHLLQDISVQQPILITFDNQGTESWKELFADNGLKDIQKSLMPQYSRYLGNNKYLLNRLNYGKMIGAIHSSLQFGIAEIK